ncbi:MAG: ABC-2 type transport system permease protein [Natronomonas sp.]|jgi:ABC-2 type transport system permease protein
MLEFFRYESRKRALGSAALAAGMGLLAAMIVWVYPSFRESFAEDELLSAYPEQLIRLFDIETMSSLEGFLAFELYAFGWIILLGLYFAYSGADLVAGDIEHGRMDTVLAMPVSRPRLLAERFGSFVVPALAVNALVLPVLLLGAELIGESVPVADLLAVHLLSIPYLFACAGIGVCCSVVFSRASVAQRVALGVTFFLFLLESLVEGTEYEPLGAVAPMRYYSPNEILLESSYDPTGVGVLVIATIGLLFASQIVFLRRDL